MDSFGVKKKPQSHPNVRPVSPIRALILTLVNCNYKFCGANHLGIYGVLYTVVAWCYYGLEGYMDLVTHIKIYLFSTGLQPRYRQSRYTHNLGTRAEVDDDMRRHIVY